MKTLYATSFKFSLLITICLTVTCVTYANGQATQTSSLKNLATGQCLTLGSIFENTLYLALYSAIPSVPVVYFDWKSNLWTLI